jgi:hypothetical protein
MSAEDNDIEGKQKDYRLRRRRNMIGLFGGIGLGLVVGGLVPWIRENLEFTSLILWSGAVGMVVTNFRQFGHAGAVLKGGENKALNYFIGLALPAALLLLVYFAVKFIF